VLRFVGEGIRLLLSQGTAALSLQQVKNVTPCQTIQLLELFDRHHCGERFSLPLDDELVVPQGDAVEDVAQPFSDF